MPSVSLCINGREKDIPFAINVPDHYIPRKVKHIPNGFPGVLLSHGAGGDLSTGNLPTFAAAFAHAGFPVLRYTCKGPRAHRVAVAKALLAKPPAPFPPIDCWILAGHSMGSRVAVQIAHDCPDLILSCLVLLSYPLHSPKDTTSLRDNPLIQLKLPIIFVRGTKDPFSQEKFWLEVMARMEAASLVQVHSVESGGHGLEVPGNAEKKEAAVQEAIEAVVRCMLKVVEEEKGKKETEVGVEKEGSSSLPMKKRHRKK